MFNRYTRRLLSGKNTRDVAKHGLTNHPIPSWRSWRIQVVAKNV